MRLLDFIEKTNLQNKAESERATFLCFYHYMESQVQHFTMQDISEMMISSGFNAPNTSRLKEKLLKGRDKAFTKSKDNASAIVFIPAILQKFEDDLGALWSDNTTIQSDSELLAEDKFCGKRKYLDQLIRQINHSYASNCYDAAAVLMRRLFEVVLVLSYQQLGIDAEIKDVSGNGYMMLDGIVRNAKNNQTLKLSRIKNEFDTFRMVGNFSAHNITYTAGKKDIDDIKLNYRVMLEELYNKAGLLT